MIVKQALLIVRDMLIDSCHAAYRSCDIDAARIGAHHDILPSIDSNTIDTVAMQDASRRTIGIKQHRTRSATITTHLIDTFTINTYQYGLVIIWTDTANGVLRLSITRQSDKLVSTHATILSYGDKVKTIFVSTNP